MTNQQTTLQRFAAVIPVLVEAGCPEPPNTYMDLHNVPEAAIAVLKEWFREKVVVWAEPQTGFYIDTPEHHNAKWYWEIGEHRTDDPDQSGSDPDPTEATLQCAEALARVIGGKGD